MASCSRFNKMAETFLSRMEETFPQEQKIKTYRIKFDMVKSMNAKAPVELFMESMLPFGEQILSKNELFFKQDEYVGKAENISGKMGLIKYWDTMTIETKNTIWEYIGGLYVMGMAVLGRQQELAELVQKVGIAHT